MASEQKDTTEPTDRLEAAKKAEELSRYFGEAAKLLRYEFMGETPGEIPDLSREALRVYNSWKRCESDSQVVGWLGKYLHDAVWPPGGIRSDDEHAVAFVTGCIEKKAPHLKDMLARAQGSILGVIGAMQNSGGGGSSPSTLDEARNELLGILNLQKVTRKTWEKAVSNCPGSAGRKALSRVLQPTPQKK